MAFAAGGTAALMNVNGVLSGMHQGVYAVVKSLSSVSGRMAALSKRMRLSTF